MKLNILSDVHNEFSVLELPVTDAEVIILAGDIDVKLRAIPWAKQFQKPVIYIAGNHEFYHANIAEFKQKAKALTQNTNIHFLDDEEVIINNVRFLGGTLWTNFSLFGPSESALAKLDAHFNMTDYRVIRIGSMNARFQPNDALRLHKKTIAFLTEKLKQPFAGKTVVVTHHAPSIKSIEKQYLHNKLTPAYASNLEHLMGGKVALWVHGHTHHSNDYQVKGTRVVSNPRGYQLSEQMVPENTEFNPAFLVEV